MSKAKTDKKKETDAFVVGDFNRTPSKTERTSRRKRSGKIQKI